MGAEFTTTLTVGVSKRYNKPLIGSSQHSPLLTKLLWWTDPYNMAQIKLVCNTHGSQSEFKVLACIDWWKLIFKWLLWDTHYSLHHSGQLYSWWNQYIHECKDEFPKEHQYHWCTRLVKLQIIYTSTKGINTLLNIGS